MANAKAQAAKEKVYFLYSLLSYSLNDMFKQGNTAFKSGDHADAVGHYTEAILADRTDSTLPLNRAAAYLKLGKYVYIIVPARPSFCYLLN